MHSKSANYLQCRGAFPSILHPVAKLKLYPCLQAAESRRDDAVFECSWHRGEMRGVLKFDDSYVNYRHLAGIRSQRNQFCELRPFYLLLLSEDLPSYLNTHVATLICRELEASSSSSQATSSSRCTLYNGMVLVLEVYNKPVGAKYLARMAVETK